VQGRNRYYYLPASNDGEIHRRLDVVVPCNLERFPLVSHHSTELFHIARIDSSIWTHKVLVNVNVGKHLVVAIPQLAVELFNALVTASGNFVNGCDAL
jgi:hypothetical protein